MNQLYKTTTVLTRNVSRNQAAMNETATEPTCLDSLFPLVRVLRHYKHASRGYSMPKVY